MKIGIISDFNLDTVNYGNHLQVYALNYYLHNHCKIKCVESIILGKNKLVQYTKVFSFEFVIKCLKTIYQKVQKQKNIQLVDKKLVGRRLEQFGEFRNRRINMCPHIVETNDYQRLDYDAIIVGSDVVWAQSRFWVNATKFLKFTTQKPFKRISYAASFGHDYIPKENVKYIRKYLNNFDAISVREHSSVSMLNDIGVHNLSYCLDPTLLLAEKEWTDIEVRPEMVNEKAKYVFVYLLGKDARQRQEIKEFALRKGLQLITVPYADGYFNVVDENFGDIQLNDCSIENWLWLIHHAEYMFTDSFHGTAFSTIFRKKFIVLKRVSEVDINNRMQDYLREIGQMDKALSSDEFNKIENLTWDYAQINKEIEIRRQNSIDFLKKALGV